MSRFSLQSSLQARVYPFVFVLSFTAVTCAAQAASLPVTSGLVYDLDAAKDVTTSGSAVTAWADAAGSGITFSQGTATHDPTLSTGFGFNHLPYVAFNGSTTTGMSSYLATTANTSPQTVFIVGQTNSTAANFLGGMFGVNSNDVGLRVDNGGGGLPAGSINNSAGGYPQNSPNGTLAWTGANGVTHPATTQLDGNSSPNLVAGTTFNTPFILSGTTVTPSFAFASGTVLGNYGYAIFGDVRSWGGEIAEVVVYDRVLTSTEQAQVVAFLDAKFFTPEPASFVLFGLGTVCLLAVARLHRRTARKTLA